MRDDPEPIKVPDDIRTLIPLQDVDSSKVGRTWPEIQDLYPSHVSSKFEFHPWQVELMLAQAQDLLERHFSEWMRYNDLKARYWEAYSTFNQLLFQLDKAFSSITLQNSAINFLIEEYNSLLENSERFTKSIDEAWLRAVNAPLNNPDYWTLQRNAFNLSNNRAIIEIESLGRKISLLKSERDIALQEYDKQAEQIRERSKAMMDHGPLALIEQFASMERQMARDFYDAEARLIAGKGGLDTYFGYSDTDSVAPLPLRDTPQASPPAYIEWTRFAMSWLTLFSQNNQAITELMSVRDTSQTDWPDILEKLSVDGAVKIQLNWHGGRVREYCYPRLIGLSATLISDDYKGVLQLHVSMPTRCIIPKTKLTAAVIDQATRPTCFLGRVRDINSVRSVEIGGSSSLRNTSPLGDLSGDLGQWDVLILNRINPKISVHSLQDIHIEVMVNVHKFGGE